MHFIQIEVVIGFIILGLVAYRATLTFFRAHASRFMMANEMPYKKESDDYSKPLLILGDSTGVGVGATKPEDSVAGRLAIYIGATYVENHAVSGATVDDLAPQIEHASLERYDTILIQIGGNDILMFHNAKKVAKQLADVLPELPDARKIYLMSAGNAGGATIFPLAVRPFHTWANLAVHREFAKVARENDVVYVNLYEPKYKDRFLAEPNRFLSADGLHPSSEGYGLWFEKLQQFL